MRWGIKLWSRTEIKVKQLCNPMAVEEALNPVQEDRGIHPEHNNHATLEAVQKVEENNEGAGA